jgi:hypothetical protein
MSSFLIKTSALRRFAEIGCQVAIAKLIIVTSADVTGTDISAVRILVAHRSRAKWPTSWTTS